MHELTGLDHPVIGVRDMQAARRDYEWLGFIVPPRGRHPEWGTGNWCIQFARDYLEIRGIIEPRPAPQTRELTEFLARREGLMGIAFGTKGAQLSHDSFAHAGLHPRPVKPLTRDFELPEGTVPVSFALCFLTREEVPGLMHVVVCEHLTPERLRRPEWLQHPNGACCVAAMIVVAPEPALLRPAWEGIFGRVDEVPNGIRAQVGAGEITALTPAAAQRRYAGVTLPPAAEHPCIASVVLGVHSLPATRRFLAGRPGVVESERGIVIPPHLACGAILEFQECPLPR
jgi:catechol 2,3-dioxygenase-like lactoylglutathione lyase family enzyme